MFGAFSKVYNVSSRNVSSPFTSLETTQKRFASKAAAGKTKNGRDSKPKFLGLKKGSGQFVKAGNILVRQKGNKYHAGEGVGTGKDFTLFATQAGFLTFSTVRFPLSGILTPGRNWQYKKFLNIVPENPNPAVKQDIR